MLNQNRNVTKNVAYLTPNSMKKDKIIVYK